MSRPKTEIEALRRTHEAGRSGPYPKRLRPAVRRLLTEGLLRQEGRYVSITEDGVALLALLSTTKEEVRG